MSNTGDSNVRTVLNTPTLAAVDVTGTTAQTILAAQGAGYEIQVLGFLLTSSGSGNAVIKGGTTTLTQVAMPGGGLMPPLREWQMLCGDNTPLTVAADTSGVRIVGHVLYMIVPG